MKTLEELLTASYGPKGSLERIAFEQRAREYHLAQIKKDKKQKRKNKNGNNKKHDEV